jgi:hypothetical protein
LARCFLSLTDRLGSKLSPELPVAERMVSAGRCWGNIERGVSDRRPTLLTQTV